MLFAIRLNGQSAFLAPAHYLRPVRQAVFGCDFSCVHTISPIRREKPLVCFNVESSLCPLGLTLTIIPKEISRKEKLSFVRIEDDTSLVGGQPMSMSNMREESRVCRNGGLLLIFDASLLADNLYFIKTRDANYRDVDIQAITQGIASLMDMGYFSARKLGAAECQRIFVADC